VPGCPDLAVTRKRVNTEEWRRVRVADTRVSARVTNVPTMASTAVQSIWTFTQIYRQMFPAARLKDRKRKGRRTLELVEN
jgi:hypothetical protein